MATKDKLGIKTRDWCFFGLQEGRAAMKFPDSGVLLNAMIRLKGMT
jgi:hypothetical protein